MSAANRRRGHNAERAVVKYLRENGWPDACTTRAKLGHDGAHAAGDVDWHPLIVCEVKDVAKSAFPSWCRQAVAESGEGQVPVVLRRTRGVPDVGKWECRFPEWAVLEGGPLVSAMTAKYVQLVATAEEPKRRRGTWWMGETFGSFVERVALIDAPRLVREGEGR